jgi:hypothetical protein
MTISQGTRETLLSLQPRSHTRHGPGPPFEVDDASALLPRPFVREKYGIVRRRLQRTVAPSVRLTQKPTVSAAAAARPTSSSALRPLATFERAPLCSIDDLEVVVTRHHHITVGVY